jgi:sporulation protein YlmC with PRC-barrel domain
MMERGTRLLRSFFMRRSPFANAPLFQLQFDTHAQEEHSMLKHTLTAAAIAAALAAPAFAQTATPNATAPAQMNKSDSMAKPAMSSDQTTFITNQNSTDWRGSKLIGATVYGPNNASIGDINDVLIANDGKVNAVVIGVGGFLGVGEKNVAIPFDRLTVSRKPESSSIDKITVSYNKDQLKGAPDFAYYQVTPPASTTGSGVGGGMKSLNPLPGQKSQ